MKQCEQCKYKRYEHLVGYYYCKIAEDDEVVAEYWDNDKDYGECVGFMNKEITKELKEKPRWKDAYYHIKLVPKKGSLEGYSNDIDIYIKGDKLSLFIADVFKQYYIKVFQANLEGFIL